MVNVLFVCAKNQWRSPTAAYIYRNDTRLVARSAGLSKQSPVTLSIKLLEWADVVLVMEKAHIQRIRHTYQERLDLPEIISLDIPDDYHYMDPNLIELLKDSTEPYLKLPR